jgi:hypothetical protein
MGGLSWHLYIKEALSGTSPGTMNQVVAWENEERIAWANLFKERYSKLASTND